jgi:hypothetical protein
MFSKLLRLGNLKFEILGVLGNIFFQKDGI